MPIDARANSDVMNLCDNRYPQRLSGSRGKFNKEKYNLLCLGVLNAKKDNNWICPKCKMDYTEQAIKSLKGN